jgi:outer membrane protein assembly factor BamB
MTIRYTTHDRRHGISRHFLCTLATWRETAFAAVLWLLAAGALWAENWDRFRGPNGAGQSDAEGIPTTWSESNILWRQSLPGMGHGSPVVWGHRLFLMSADPATGAQIVQAFDSVSGTPLWERRYDAPTYSMHQFNSFASSTPALDSQHVYIMWLANGRITLAALTHDGDEVWQRDVGTFSEKHGFGKSPIVVGDVVCVANDNEGTSSVVAFDSASGNVRWQLPRTSPVQTAFATPCLFDPSAAQKVLLTVSTATGLAAIDAATGKLLWEGLADAVPLRCVSSPIVAQGLVFISSGVGGNGKFFVAARPGRRGSGPEEVYRLQQNVPNVPTPVVFGDLLFLWHDRGTVSCHEVATGQQHWRERVGGDYHSSPLAIGERIFCASKQGEMIVLAADRQFKVLARNPLGEPCHATPAIAHNRMYVRTETALLCVGEPALAANN